MFKSIQNRLLGTYLILIAFVVFFLIFTFSFAIINYYSGSVRSIIKNQLEVTVNFYNNYLDSLNIEADGQKIVDNFSYLPFQIQVLNANALIIADSVYVTSFKKVISPEVTEAFLGKQGSYEFKDLRSGEYTLAYTMPLKSQNKVVGVVRFLASIDNTIKTQRILIIIVILIGVVIISFSFVFSVLMAKRITIPIIHLTEISKKIAEGDFSVKAKVFYDDETGKLAESLNFMGSELDKNDKLKYEFISSISHELRTPLTSIIGWSLTLENIVKMKIINQENSIEKGLSIISEETQRLSDLVEELLDFSQIQSNRLKLKKEEVELVNFVKEICIQMHPRANKLGINIEMSKVKEEIFVKIDPRRIKQVLINLIDNALKHTPSNGLIQISLLKKIVDDSPKVIIKVIDTGAGIALKDIPFIKEKFYKRNANEGDKGIGLGLSISHQIINLHLGSLDLDSKEKEGTSVTITLPLE